MHLLSFNLLTGEWLDDAGLDGGEQIGGGNGPIPADQSTPETTRYSFRRNIPLTPNAQPCHHMRNTSSQQEEDSLPIPPNFSQEEFFDGLDDDTIPSMAHDKPSPFPSTPSPTPRAVPPSEVADNNTESIKPHSLLEDFYPAAEFEPLIITPGPIPSGNSVISLVADIVKDRPLETASSKVSTEPQIASTSPKHGRLSNVQYAKLKACFDHIDIMFSDLASSTNCTVDVLRCRYVSSRGPQPVRQRTI